jgi:SAM-dependent methyltransferase
MAISPKPTDVPLRCPLRDECVARDEDFGCRRLEINPSLIAVQKQTGLCRTSVLFVRIIGSEKTDGWFKRVDAIAQVKQAQKESWTHFAPLEAFTTPAAARLVRHAGVTEGMRVLDVGCGTGVVAITAGRLGAHVWAIDLTPQLLERARENARIAEVDVDWREADAEELPFGVG